MLETSLHLSEIRFKYISSLGLRVIAASQCCPTLRIIKAEVSVESADAIKDLCQTCPNLITLDLVTDMNELLGDEILRTIAKNCPMIESISTERWHLTDVGVKALATMHRLRELKLGFKNCTSAAVQRVITANPNLSVISMKVLEVDEALVNCIGRCCGNLTRLELFRTSSSQSFNALSNNTLVALFRGCPLLESLLLYQHNGITSIGLRAMFEYCHNLTELDIGNTSPEAVQASDLEPVLYAPYLSLSKLKLSFGGVSTRALRDIFTFCTNLRVVDVEECEQYTDETSTVLARGCINLESITLNGCESVSIAGVLQLATHCSSLKSLGLLSVPVDNEVLIQLSLRCRSLTSLYMFRCEGGPITESGIHALVEGCTGLTQFTISGGMVESTAPTLERLKEGKFYPHIKFNYLHSF